MYRLFSIYSIIIATFLNLCYRFSTLTAIFLIFVLTDNLVENLLDFEYELKKPYLLYRNAAQEVNGIWFYNPDECEEVANLFNRYGNLLIFSTQVIHSVFLCLFMLKLLVTTYKMLIYYQSGLNCEDLFFFLVSNILHEIEMWDAYLASHINLYNFSNSIYRILNAYPKTPPTTIPPVNIR